MNKFEKEYVTDRKDQFDVDYDIFKKATEETETGEDLILKIEERFNYVISHMASERATDLLQEMNLI